MRKVVVDGRTYELPDNGNYVVYVREKTPTASLEKRYTFPPRGGCEVHVRTAKYPAGWVVTDFGNNAVPQPEVHEEIRHIMAFMYDIMYPNPCSKMKNKTRKKDTRPPKAFFTSHASHTDKVQEDLYYRLPGHGKERENQLRHAPAPGQRVTFARLEADPLPGRACGTVVGQAQKILKVLGDKVRASNYGPSDIVVAADESRKEYNQTEFFHLTGEWRALIAIKRDLQPVPKCEGSPAAWAGVPDDIGISVPNPFAHEGVLFPTEATGRIIETNAEVGRRLATVRWNYRNKNFWSHPVTGDPNCFEVPMANIQMARLGGVSADIPLNVWPLNFPEEQLPSFKVGDLVEIHTQGGQRIPFYTNKNGREEFLPAGAVGEITDQHGPCVWRLKICGGVEPADFGAEITAAQELLRPLAAPECFFSRGTEVEICAEIEFRKVSLKGKRAKVILPTDSDGDVGLEFTEDLKAGSLDGAGKEGHCLYVEASTVKTPE